METNYKGWAHSKSISPLSGGRCFGVFPSGRGLVAIGMDLSHLAFGVSDSSRLACER